MGEDSSFYEECFYYKLLEDVIESVMLELKLNESVNG